MKLLLTCPPMIKNIKRYEAKIAEYGFDLTIPEFTQVMKEEDLIRIVPEFDAWIIGDDPATRAVFEAGKSGNLKVAAKWGVGVDNVDFEACKDLNIPITNTPMMFGEEVSDVAIGFMLNLTRDLHVINAAVKKGNWIKPAGMSLSGKKACLVGFGDIGQCTARKLLAFNLKVLCSDPNYYKEDGIIKSKNGAPIQNNLNGVEITSLEEASKDADFIITTCNLNQFTHHLINEEIIKNAKKDVYIINVARGPVVKTDALLNMKEHIGGIGLDVFETEPLPQSSLLYGFEKRIFGTHNGSHTIEGVDRVSLKVLDFIKDFFSN